ncbi:hypothetical protein BGX23_003140 [Mortierella sp. AD031]|nr:hypothetical protein BGX23_003140 [Mortierella sp. AD031]
MTGVNNSHAQYNNNQAQYSNQTQHTTTHPQYTNNNGFNNSRSKPDGPDKYGAPAHLVGHHDAAMTVQYSTQSEEYARGHSQGLTAAATTIQVKRYPRLPALAKDGVPLETSVVFVGSPGVGKSTLLNALGGNFASGSSEVRGLTREVTDEQVTTDDGRPLRLFDVPGIDDVVAKGGAETIGRHLQMLQDTFGNNGRFVIFFIVTPRNGRIDPSDYMIMKTVIDSLRQVPLVGLIATQVKKKHLAQLQKVEYGLDVWETLASTVESKEFVSMRRPLILAEHEEGFSEDEKLAILNYVLSFEPKPVKARNMVEIVIRRYFKDMKLGLRK